ADLFLDYQSESQRDLITALLHYADQRLNLDFQSCRRSLSGKDGAIGGRYRIDVSRLYAEVATTDASWMLREVFWGAKLKYDRGEYADFIGRIFRFQEGCLRYLAEQLGTQFADERGAEFDRAWVEQHEGLSKKLVRDDELMLYVDRANLHKVISFLAKAAGNTSVQKARNGLVKINALADLRNRTQIAHGYTGLSKQVLADYFSLKPEELKAGKHVDPTEANKILDQMRESYEQTVGDVLGENPFDAVNALIQRIFHPEGTR
ncbi:MAG: hypothetical protein WCG26_12290, partial [Chloroflexales bacterium]